MKNNTVLFSRILFILTLAFHTTACVVFGVKLLAMDPPSVNENAFNGILYWIIVIVVTTWYTCLNGFAQAKHLQRCYGKLYLRVLIFFLPMIFGFIAGFLIYYIIQRFLALYIGAFPFVVVFLLLMSLFTVIKTLIGIYFGLDDIMNPSLRKITAWFAFIVAFGLLLALFIF
jgi:hypothetical protein